MKKNASLSSAGNSLCDKVRVECLMQLWFLLLILSDSNWAHNCFS